MTISELGSLGEFIGSIIVIVTLVYIAIQSNLNHKLLLSNAFSTRANATAEFINITAQNGEFAEIWYRAIQNQALTPVEEHRATAYLVALLKLTENTFYQNQLGLIEEDYQKVVTGGFEPIKNSRFLRRQYQLARHVLNEDCARMVDAFLLDERP